MASGLPRKGTSAREAIEDRRRDGPVYYGSLKELASNKKEKAIRLSYRRKIFELVAKGVNDEDIKDSLNANQDWRKFKDFFDTNIIDARKKLDDLKQIIRGIIMQEQQKGNEIVDNIVLENLMSREMYACYSQYFGALIAEVRSDLQKEAQERQSEGIDR